MAKKPQAIEVGDQLVLQVDVVRVDEGDHGSTVTFAINTASSTTVRVTIRQDNVDIVEVVKAPKEHGRPIFDKRD